MKTTILTTAALIGAVLFPAVAFSNTLGGCELIDKGGYFNLADPACLSDGSMGEDRIPEPKEEAPAKK